MDITNEFTPIVTAIISAFALAWLLIGIAVGWMIRSGVSSRINGNKPRFQKDRKERKRHDGSVVELYVGNLSYDVSEKELNKTFQQYGEVVSARIIKHRFSGQSKGFGFVEMANRREAEDAISALHNKDMKGRKLVVNEAKSRSRDD